jgi:oligopeptide transport system substrate-binding protein
MLRALAPFALLALMVGGVVALDRPLPRAEIVFVSPDVFTLDPQRVTYQQDVRVAQSIFEGLCTESPDGADPRPGAAESWSVSPDGRTWTFTLRPDARWSNGDPVTSEDFARAWMRPLLPDLAADYSGFLFLIRGGRELFEWRARELEAIAKLPEGTRAEAARDLWARTIQRYRDTVAVRTPDLRTIEVELVQPTPYWPSIAAFPTLFPVHRPTLDAHLSIDPESGRVRIDPAWLKPGTLVSNGPMMVTDWRYKRGMRFEPNPHYWNRASVRPASVELRPIEDSNTAVLAFQSGDVDWISDLTVEYRADMADEQRAWLGRHASQWRALQESGMDDDAAMAALPAPGPGERRDVHVLPALGTDFWNFNCRPTLPDGRPNPFSDARVRRAFARAVDKQAITEKVTRLRELVSGSLVPAGAFDWYEPPAGLSHDPDAARAELAAAGWSDRDGDGRIEDAQGKRFPVVDILYMTGNPRTRDVALALAQMWRETLGVECELRGKDGKFAKEDLRTGNFMVARGGWFADYPDPTTFLELNRSTDGNNDRAYRSPAYDALLDAAAAEVDRTTRAALLRDAERILVEQDMPLMPLCQYVTVYMYDPAHLRGLSRRGPLAQYLDRLHRPDAAAPGAPSP